MNRIKCQSLGNSFVLLDYYKTEEAVNETLFARPEESCDGTLVLQKNSDGTPSVKIFNLDGSDGQLCLNGARCVARHLHTVYKFPHDFSITMGKKTIRHVITPPSISQFLDMGKCLDKTSVPVDGRLFHGTIVDVGNPHFIIRQSCSLDWLKAHGSIIEHHSSFPNRTNVEFIWKKNPSEYEVLVYERGCGITQACSSGAAAIATLLFTHGGEKDATLHMLGGAIKTSITPDHKIVLHVVE